VARLSSGYTYLVSATLIERNPEMIHATVTRTDHNADKYGEVAFEASFRTSSEQQIYDYMERLIDQNADTIGSYRIDLKKD